MFTTYASIVIGAVASMALLWVVAYCGHVIAQRRHNRAAFLRRINRAMWD